MLDFCKDCHKAFLQGNAELKRKIIKIVCSNFSYDGSNIVIEPNPIFKYNLTDNFEIGNIGII